jgi:tetratricopeptide (TPR) repeat protein
MYADSRHYREYQRMLVRLHKLIAHGQGDTPDALALREEMEEPERHLSPEETIRLNALSGDLSMLHDREIPDPDVTRSVPAAELPQRLVRAHQQEDWEESLRLLRADVSRFLSPDQVAYLRSRAYEALDELAPAIAFMDEAARRVPTSANFRALAMELLLKDARHEEAYDRAKNYLNDPATPARLVLMAGGIVSREAQQDRAPPDIGNVAGKAIDRIEHALPTEQSPAILMAGHAALGLLAARVGDRNKAESALQQAIDVEVRTDRQLTARGLLLAELELIRGGQLQSAQERSLARELADILVPDRYAVAA